MNNPNPRMNPPCDSPDGHHDWQRPHDIVGGIDSNPGVWGSGGTGIIETSVCMRCGTIRTRRTGDGRRRTDVTYDAYVVSLDDTAERWLHRHGFTDGSVLEHDGVRIGDALRATAGVEEFRLWVYTDDVLEATPETGFSFPDGGGTILLTDGWWTTVERGSFAAGYALSDEEMEQEASAAAPEGWEIKRYGDRWTALRHTRGVVAPCTSIGEALMTIERLTAGGDHV